MHMLAFFAEFAVRALLLGTLGTIVAWTLQKRGAEVQHATWRIVLVGMLALPLLMMVLPPLPILPSGNTVSRVANAVSALQPSRPAEAPSSFAARSNNAVVLPPESSPRGLPLPEWPVLVLAAYAVVAILS